MDSVELVAECAAFPKKVDSYTIGRDLKIHHTVGGRPFNFSQKGQCLDHVAIQVILYDALCGSLHRHHSLSLEHSLIFSKYPPLKIEKVDAYKKDAQPLLVCVIASR